MSRDLPGITRINNQDSFGHSNARPKVSPKLRSKVMRLMILVLSMYVLGTSITVYHRLFEYIIFDGNAADKKLSSYIGEQDVLGFAKDGSSYKGLKCEDTSRSNKYESRHYILATTELLLLNQIIGNVTRICEGEYDKIGSDNIHTRCVLPTGKNIDTPQDQNINSPMPIRTKRWMNHPSIQGMSVILYYSSHTSDAISMLGLDSSKKMWKHVGNAFALEFEPKFCVSLHSPSIFVDEKKKRFYMYVHGHGCEPHLNATSNNYQPTLLYQSDDGASWRIHEHFTQDTPYLFHNLFYLTNPVLNVGDGFYYIMARINGEPGIVLCRSKSIEGPFDWGPRLGLSLRHFDIHFVDGIIYVLYSMIGDTPERILLGSIDTTISTNWNDWKLLPGPRVLEPQYWYEHQNTNVTTSKEGLAKEDRHRISDPRLLLDEDMGPEKISGLMFYSVQGEKEIATSRIVIDLALYRNATSFRDHTNIPPKVLRSTSLVTQEAVANSTVLTDLLITGVGRIGTTSMCTLLRQLGIMVSHDNDVDCGPYPGRDGAVSWYDAFKPLRRRYKYVIHMVRNPLQTISSRITKCTLFYPSHLEFLKRTTSPYEKYTNDDTCSSFSIKHWVRRNSFVEQHASWRVHSESVLSDPLSLWELCMAAGFGTRCPALSTIKIQIKNMSTSLNSHHSGATLSKKMKMSNMIQHTSKQGLQSWELLTNTVEHENYKYIQIAKSMAVRYGYIVPKFTPVGFDCKFTEREGEENDYWDCFLGGNTTL